MRSKNNIVPYNEIEIPAVGSLHPRCRSAPGLRRYPTLSRHILEMAPPLVVQQHPTPIRRNVDVHIPIVIVVTHCTAQKMPVQSIQTGLLGDVLEVSFTVIMEEGEGGADEEDIEVAVVIEIEEGASVADGLEDVERSRAGDDPPIIQTGIGGHVNKARSVWRIGRVVSTTAGTSEKRKGKQLAAREACGIHGAAPAAEEEDGVGVGIALILAMRASSSCRATCNCGARRSSRR